MYIIHVHECASDAGNNVLCGINILLTYNDVVDHLGVVVLDRLVEEEQAHGVEDGNQCHEQLKDSVRMKSFKDNSIDYLRLKHKCMFLQPYSLASYTHSPSPIHYAEINKTQAGEGTRV